MAETGRAGSATGGAHGIVGEWDCVTDTPMGRQESRLVLRDDGLGGFTGTNEAALGALAVYDGTIDGSDVRFRMDMKLPVPMTLDAHVLLEGDTLAGSVKLGAFGTAALRATRRVGRG